MPSQGLTSADSGEPTGAGTPADALGEPKRMSANDAETQESYECPTCSRSDFDSQRAMRLHHYHSHGESIAYESYICELCDEPFEGLKCKSPRFCSQECADKGRIHTEKPWTDEETLRELYIDEGLSATQIGERLGCNHITAMKWLRKTDVRQDLDEFNCPECGAGFHTRSSVTGHMKTRHGESEFSTLVEVGCDYCGSELEVKPAVYEKNTYHFCGQECHYAWRRIHQADIDGWPPTGEDHPMWQIGENHPRFNGGRAGYGKGWNERKRRIVRERDGYECQGCGMSESEHIDEYGRSLSVHHIIPARQLDDPEVCNSPENLIALCKGCHSKWEGIPLRPQTE